MSFLKLSKVIGIAFGVVTFLSITAYGDEIILKDGGNVKGKIIETVPGKSYKIETLEGNIFVFKMETVEKVLFGQIEEKIYVKEKGMTDEIILKDGGRVKGKIIETIPDKSYKIETASGNTFVFKMDEVEKVKFGTKPSVPKRELSIAPAKEEGAFSVGIGMFSWEPEKIEEENVQTRFDIRYMTKEGGFQIEIGKWETDIPQVYGTFIPKCSSIGISGLCLSKTPLWYLGGGISQYKWSFDAKYDPNKWWVITRPDDDCIGFHFLGGIEHYFSENFSISGEMRCIIAELDEKEGWASLDVGGFSFGGKIQINF